MENRELVILLIAITLISIVLLIVVIVFKPKITKFDVFDNTEPKTRIVGGTRVSIHAHPYIAGIIIRKHGDLERDELQCGCAIISSDWVVTAAHCLTTILEQKFTKEVVYISSTNAKWRKGQQHDIVNWINHENYDPDVMRNDICLMRVEQPFTGSREKPIPIANNKYRYRPDTAVMVTGWGKISENNDNSVDELRGVMVKIVNQTECVEWYKAAHSYVTDEMVCAGYPQGGKDACQFDSGGPIVDRNLLIGIVSWGVGCANARQPGVYTRISLYETWITETTKKLKHPIHGVEFKSRP